MASSSSSGSRCFQGPICSIVFCLQQSHISAQVFRGDREINVPAEARRADGNLWRQWANEMVTCGGTANYVAEMGFGVFFKLGYMRADHNLLSALLERFRPETHTFLFPNRESMISLQDVEVNLGLKVDGYVVGSNPSGLEVPNNDWEVYVQDLLGLDDLEPGSSYFEGKWLVTSHLEARIRKAATFDQEDMQQRARCFVLWILGNALFINSKKNQVHRDMVLCVADAGVCRGYSWGSAMLAYLLHELSKAALQAPTQSVYINGATQLLQHWAYERIAIFRPEFRNLEGFAPGMPVVGGPLGSRYTDGRCIQRREKLDCYRDQLTVFSWDQVLHPSLRLEQWRIIVCCNSHNLFLTIFFIFKLFCSSSGPPIGAFNKLYP